MNDNCAFNSSAETKDEQRVTYKVQKPIFNKAQKTVCNPYMAAKNQFHVGTQSLLYDHFIYLLIPNEVSFTKLVALIITT